MESLVSKTLSDRLNTLQETYFSKNIPVLIIFEGSSGRIINRVINEIKRCMEPRAVSYHHFEPGDMENPRDFFDYLHATPAKGTMALYDRSWYSYMVSRFDEDKNINDSVDACIAFESYLIANGIFLLKIFLDISPGVLRDKAGLFTPMTQMNSFLSADKIDAVKFRAVMEAGLLEDTDIELSPWDRVVVSDVDPTVDAVAEAIANRMQAWLDNPRTEEKAVMPNNCPFVLGRPAKHAKCSDCDKEMEKYSERLNRLQNVLSISKLSLAVCFEGRDAAGKGTVIKHLTHALNPRGYTVHQTKAPNCEELAHTYLWRFSKSMPDKGHITIFDRTWYGRMLVEPIEGFCTDEEYARSACEINAMEKMMADNGTIIIKFWMEISKDVQLERFKDREKEPLKNWKITEDDWRNREKWDLYDRYIERMFRSTNTDIAPWIVIPSEDKKVARLAVIKTIAERLESALRSPDVENQTRYDN